MGAAEGAALAGGASRAFARMREKRPQPGERPKRKGLPLEPKQSSRNLTKT